MPKSSSPASKLPRLPPDSPDASLVRKKKNADAQAAFRARRQNYISTLEETVTSLESVVIQLQDSCRETRNENLELRQEISRLRYENREREKYWKAFIQARKAGQSTHSHDDHHPTVSSSFPGPSNPHHSSSLLPPGSYGSTISYRTPDQSYDNVTNPNFVDQHTPSVAFTNHDGIDGSSIPHPDRGGKYAYPYSIPDSPRDTRWQLPTPLPPALNGNETVTSQSQSPSYIESPSLTAPTDLYPGRFPTNDRKVALDAALNGAHYVFPNANRYDSIPNSRSMSPTTSASSATSLPLTSSYQLAFQDTPTGQDHTEFDYRGQSLSHCPDVTLHGGIAEFSMQPDSGRFRFTRRSDSSNADNQDDLPMLPQNDSTTRLRGNRRSIGHPYRRSQSPGPTPLSSTVAVIKAQAFGALRRTRAKTKKTTDSAARVAQDVLEARGIGVGPMPSAKLHEGDDDVGKSVL